MQQLKQHKIFLYILIFLMTISMAVPLGVFAGEGISHSVKVYYRNLNKPMAVIELTDADGATQTFDQLKTTPGSYLSASLSLGECQYKVYKDAAKNSVVGYGSLNITSTTTEVYLCYMDISVKYNLSTEELSDYGSGGTVTVKDEKGGMITPGNIYSNSNASATIEHHEYVTVASNLPAIYTYDIQPNDSKIENGSGSLSFTNKNILQWGVSGNGATALNPLKHSATFYVTKGAPFNLYSKGEAHYTPFTRYEPTLIDTSSDQDYDIYTYTNNLPLKALHYVAGGGHSGFLKQGRYISYAGNTDKQVFKIDLSSLDNSRREDSGYLEDNLYLNVDDSKYKQLDLGKSFKLEAFRVWQSVNSVTDNYFIEPDFHYEVIGKSVALDHGGEPGREYETVKGLEPGISIIKITYDAMEWKDPYITGNTDKGDIRYYNAIDPINIGVVIVNVGGNNDANLQTNIKQTEYDTIYFDSDKTNYAEYTFKPTADEALSVEVHDPLYDTEWGKAWTEYEANQDGSYTVKLKEGRNIIKVSAGDSEQYYVINARGLKIQIENETNPGQSFKIGDMVKINFKGLSQPIQKMAGIYNPGYPGTCWVQYQTESGRILQSEGVQYDVILENDIEFILTKSGTMELVNGQIHAGHLGSALGTHRNIPDIGMLPNLNASGGENSPYFSTLPTITLEVTDEGTDKEQNKITYAQLQNLKAKLGTNEMAWNLSASSWMQLNEIRNKAENWEGNTTAQSFLITPTLLNDEVDIAVRYYLHSNMETFVEVSNLDDGKLSQIIDNLNIGDIAYIEITLTPKDATKGYPQTYTLRASNNANSNYPYLSNLVLNPVNGKADMESLDGLLKPVTDGDTDIGYGFIPTRNEFSAHVPYSVDKITLTPTKIDADSIKINNIEVQSGKASETIGLLEGTNNILVTCSYGSETATYAVTVTRDEKPSTIQFDADEGANLEIKTSRDKLIEANEDGMYLLSSGTYTYIYSKTGYLTTTGTFNVEKDTTCITLPKLNKVNQTYGDVMVRAIGQDKLLRDNTTISFTADSGEDLAKQTYVEYNNGGYTALHAIIETFNTGISKIGFSCYKGELTPKIDIDKAGQGSNAGWVCEVNGKVCDPASTLVNNGDQIDFYYNPDYAGMKHVWFDNNFITVDAGNNATVTLMATDVKNNGTAAKGLDGATIKVNGQVIGVTDAQGKLTVPTAQIEDPGRYNVTAEKQVNGKNILTYAFANIMVKKVDVVAVPGKVTVKFRLIGDAKHTGKKHGSYVNWIATKKYTFDGDSVSVYDVFTKALDKAGLNYVGAERNYVSKISAPKAYGGYWLGEFDNGKNSGWMYTVNGEYPEYGLKDFRVTNGDSIIWHYVDDYIKETPFNGKSASEPPEWPSDQDPPSGGSVIDMSNGNLAGEEVVKTGDSATVTVPTSAKVDANGKATASIGKSDIKEAIEKVLKIVEENEKGTVPTKKIIIDVSGTEKASTIDTTVQRGAAVELSEKIDTVVLKTTIGEVSFDKNSFSSMVKQTTGDLKFTITKQDSEKILAQSNKITEEDKGKIQQRPVYEFTAEAGGKVISEFSGIVTMKIPYEKSEKEMPQAIVVYWLQDSGKLSPVLSSKLSSDGKYVEITTKHWSTYVIGYNNIRFLDTEKHWANNDICYLGARDIIKGKSSDVFSPDNQITRAEFIQILANLSNNDLSKYDSSRFTDVPENAWYAKAVAWAVENGIAGGTGDDTFSPNANITRQDMSVMISKYATNISKTILQNSNDEVTFTDESDIASYAKTAVNAMQKAGIISGSKNSFGMYSFNPKSNATRAEATTMIANFLKN